MSLIQGGTGTKRGRSTGSSTSLSTLANAGQNLAAAAANAAFEAITGARFDPAPDYLFSVELEGLIVGLFTSCSGLSVKRDVETVTEGGNNTFQHHLPGRISQNNVTLKRGMSISRVLWDWFETGMYDFNVQRINFSIIQGAPGHNLVTAVAAAAANAAATAGGVADNDIYTTAESLGFQALGSGFGKVKHWNLIDAYPISWKVGEMKTSGKGVVIEEIEIAHHGLELSYEVGTPMSIVSSLASAGKTGVGMLTE